MKYARVEEGYEEGSRGGEKGGEEPMTDSPLTPCRYCGGPIPRGRYSVTEYAKLQFCSITCANRVPRNRNPDLPSNGARRPRTRLLDTRPLPIARFTRGLDPDQRTCPKCHWLLEADPPFLHCRGCGTYWPVQDAPYQEVFEPRPVLVPEVPDDEPAHPARVGHPLTLPGGS